MTLARWIIAFVLATGLAWTPCHAGAQLERANSEYLSSTDAALRPSTPFLILGWAKCTSCTSGQHTVAGMATASSTTNGHYLIENGDSSDSVQATTRQNAGTQQTAQTTTSFSSSTWTAVAGYWVSASDRRAYINGGSKGTNTGTETPATMDVFYFGKKGTTNYFSGTIAEMAMYNCSGATTTAVEADISAHATGDNPTTLHACTLIEYWPMSTNGNGQCNSINLTSNGTITFSSGDHPSVDAFVSCSSGTTTGDIFKSIYLLMGK